MEKVFEICHIPIPCEKIIEYRIWEREYIYRPAYYVTTEMFRGKRYHFSHMVPYAAIYAEAEYKSATKAYKAITANEAIKQDVANGLLAEIGDKFNIKVWKYSKFTCRNQAGRVFSTYLQDVPACIETEEGKRSEVYPNDELYKELGEPIAPSIEFIPSLLILTKDEFFTFYGKGIQIDAEYEYERLKACMTEYLEEKEAAEGAKKNILQQLPKIPRIVSPNIVINIPQFGKRAEKQLDAIPVVQLENQEMKTIPAEQQAYDMMDLNHDGVVDEKDLELLKQRVTENDTQ